MHLPHVSAGLILKGLKQMKDLTIVDQAVVKQPVHFPYHFFLLFVLSTSCVLLPLIRYASLLSNLNDKLSSH